MALGNNMKNENDQLKAKDIVIPEENGTDEIAVLKKRISDLEQEKEMALREVEARMLSVDQACIVSETDLRGYITYVNDKHCEVSQYSREELLGANQNIVRHPDMPKELFKELWATIGRGKIFRGKVKNRKKDGTPYYVDGIFTPVLGANGKPVKYIGVRFDITDMELERQRMKGIVDAIDASYAFIEFDTQGNVLEANNNFLKTMGYHDLKEIQGRHHRIFVDQAYAASPEYAKFWEELRHGKIQNGEFSRVTSAGKVIHLQAVYSPVKDEMGRILKVVKIATDVSEQVRMREEAKQAAEELKAQEEEIRQQMEEMTATQEEMARASAEMKGITNAIDASFASIEFDPQGNVLTANNNFLSAMEYSLEEIKGKHHRMFVDRVYASSAEYSKFWADLANGQEKNDQFKRYTRSGKEVWLQAVYSPVKDNTGRIIKVLKIATDITAQKIAALNAEGLKNTVDISFAEIEFDEKGTILHANDNFVRTLGYYSAKDLVGGHHSMFVDEEYKRSSAYKKFWEDLGNGYTQDGEFKRIRKDGKEVWIQAAYTPVKDDKGKVVKVIKIAIDITAQKQTAIETEAAANEVNRVISALAAGDLTQQYSIDSKGDLKVMGDSLNAALKSLNDLLGNISQVANLVASSAEELLTKGEQMGKTTQEVASATVQMAEGASQQAQQTDESSKLIADVLRSANEMGKKAEVINVAAERGQKSATDGLSTIRKVVDNMTEILQSANLTSSSINVLAQRSEEIASTLSVITDIASQTNLLALNAAIEAARAGDAGRGFAVVAEEIRKLAEGSRKSAIDIEKVIREVQKDVSSAGKSIETMESSVKSGNVASKEAEVVFQNIEKTSVETLDLSKEIVEATNTQKDSINATVKNIEKIVVVAEETASGTEQVASSGKELAQGMNEVTATSKDLASVANQLQDSVSKFKLKK